MQAHNIENDLTDDLSIEVLPLEKNKTCKVAEKKPAKESIPNPLFAATHAQHVSRLRKNHYLLQTKVNEQHRDTCKTFDFFFNMMTRNLAIIVAEEQKSPTVESETFISKLEKQRKALLHTFKKYVNAGYNVDEIKETHAYKELSNTAIFLKNWNNLPKENRNDALAVSCHRLKIMHDYKRKFVNDTWEKNNNRIKVIANICRSAKRVVISSGIAGLIGEIAGTFLGPAGFLIGGAMGFVLGGIVGGISEIRRRKEDSFEHQARMRVKDCKMHFLFGKQDKFTQRAHDVAEAADHVLHPTRKFSK